MKLDKNMNPTTHFFQSRRASHAGKVVRENTEYNKTIDITIFTQAIRSSENTREFKEAKKLLESVFQDIKGEAINRLTDNLRAMPEVSDKEVIKHIYNWYSCAKVNECKDFKASNSYSQHEEALQKAHIITNNVGKILKPESKLLDIGSGNCVETRDIAQILDVTPVALDVETDTNWGTTDDEEEKGIRKVIYDGKNMKSIFGEEKFDVIMYNHSLHHFPDYETQLLSLKQAYDLLDDKGVLMLSEHANIMSDIVLDQGHSLLHLRCEIDNNKAHNADDAVNIVERYEELHGKTNYFSINLLEHSLQQAGFSCEILDLDSNQLDTTKFDETKIIVAKKISVPMESSLDDAYACYKEMASTRHKKIAKDDTAMCSDVVDRSSLTKPIR